MYWLWGGFSVDNPTLNRFYSFHYTLPFVLAGLSVFHIAALHQYGSTNPLGINSQSSTLAFGTYFGAKDLLGALFLALVFSILVFFYPDLLGHPDNLIPANPYSTPQHIVPEWLTYTSVFIGFKVFRKDTPVINPNRSGVFAEMRVSDAENRVLLYSKTKQNKRTTQVVHRFHWSSVPKVDPAVSNLILMCAKQQSLLNKARGLNKLKHGVKLSITQTDGSLHTVWIPKLLYQVLCGLLISDGSIRPQRQASMQFVLGMGSSPLASDLVILVSAMLEICKLGYGMISLKQIWDPTQGQIYNSLECVSITSPIFTRLYSIWYRSFDSGELFGHKPGSTKVEKVLYPNNLAPLTSLAFCMAFLGDGYVQNKNQLLIATLAYSYDSVSNLIKHLHKVMGIQATIQSDHPNTRKAKKLPPRGKVYFSPQNAYLFIGQIICFMPQSSLYKLPVNFAVPASANMLSMSGKSLLNILKAKFNL